LKISTKNFLPSGIVAISSNAIDSP
jgi:hypothetical protein